MNKMTMVSTTKGPARMPQAIDVQAMLGTAARVDDFPLGCPRGAARHGEHRAQELRVPLTGDRARWPLPPPGPHKFGFNQEIAEFGTTSPRSSTGQSNTDPLKLMGGFLVRFCPDGSGDTSLHCNGDA